MKSERLYEIWGTIIWRNNHRMLPIKKAKDYSLHYQTYFSDHVMSDNRYSNMGEFHVGHGPWDSALTKKIIIIIQTITKIKIGITITQYRFDSLSVGYLRFRIK